METTIKTVVREITPELANELLNRNGINRNLNQRLVDGLVHEMKTGNWKLTGQGITISKTGKLLDGQHRLSAIIQYGKGVQMLIIYGIDDEAFAVYDCGKKRSARDIFDIASIPNSTNIAAGIRAYIGRRDYNVETTIDSIGYVANRGFTISNLDVLNEYKSDPEFYQKLTNVCQVCYTKLRIFSQTTLFGFAAYIIKIRKYDEDYVYQFIKEISGIIDPSVDSTKLLRDSFIRDKVAIKRMDNKTKSAIFNKAWNHFIKKSTLKILKYDRERDQFPELM